MNKVIETIKRNRKQAIILGSVFLVVIVGLIIGRTLTFSDPNSGYLRNQTVDGLSFENATLEYEDGVTTFEAKVYNESGSEYTLKTINVI